MDHDRLEADLKGSAAVRLLRADSAPMVVSALYRLFKRKQQLSVAYDEALEILDGHLGVLNEPEPVYRLASNEYLKQWADDQHRWIRIIRRDNADWVELTPDAERAIGWVEDLNRRSFIGTESRFMSVVQLLSELTTRSVADPEQRIRELESQRRRIDEEIKRIQQTGEVERLTATQLIERFFQAEDNARQLLRDFAAVEDSFRGVARVVRDAQLQEGVRKGSVLEAVLDSEERLRDSDEGRSFDAFWQFLRSPQRQRDLEALIEAVYALPDLKAYTEQSPLLRRMISYLLDAGNKIVQSNQRLAAQLRRMLDQAHLEESRRVRVLIASVKRAAHGLATNPPDGPILHLEGSPHMQFVMDRPLWTPTIQAEFDVIPQIASSALSETALTELAATFYISEDVLFDRIERMLADRDVVTLGQLTERFQIEQGLAELVSYVALASKTPPHRVLGDQYEVITVRVDDEILRDYTVPLVEFRRNDA